MSKEIFVNQRNISLQIWDTAGQERFQSLGGGFYRGSDCCLLVYDIADEASFESLDTWKEQFLKAVSPSNPEQFPFIVAGNKCDLENDRKVPKEKAEEWCKMNNNIPLYEVSAKENTNVEEMFVEIGKMVSAGSEEEEMYNVQSVKIDHTTTQKKSGGCACWV